MIPSLGSEVPQQGGSDPEKPCLVSPLQQRQPQRQPEATLRTTAECLSDYERYLERVVGIVAATREKYLAFAKRFLTTQFESDALPDWSSLDGTAITEFVRREAQQRRNYARRAPTTTIRSLLRYAAGPSGGGCPVTARMEVGLITSDALRRGGRSPHQYL